MTGWVLWALVAASGDERISLEVVYEAPEACPPRARFEAELKARSEKLRIVDAAQTPQAQVTVRIVTQKKRYVGTSKLRTLLSGVTTREFKSAQCETLVQAAALATALLLDPEGTKTGAVMVELAPVVVAPADAGVPEPIDAGVVAPPVVIVDAGVVEPLVLIDAGPPVPVEPARDDPHVELSAGGGVTSGLSGAVDPLVQLTVALQLSRFRLALSPQFVFGRRVTSSAGVAQYVGVGGRFDALASFPVGRLLRIEGGASVTVLVLPVTGPDAEVPGRALGVLVAPGPFARIALQLGHFRVALEGGAGINLRAERYLIDGAGLVFAAPRLFGLLGASVGWSF
ncbi:MAG: hypothetical protein Q8L14_30510 [Myxococcales bacterium]|nr:hypothetical protein [Myxococcales bacterium]